MKAVKGNKEYSITDTQKMQYQNDGFNILDDDGKLLAVGKGKTVSYEKYQKVVEELEILRASIGGSTIDAMTIEELIAYAAEKGIDIGQSTSQSGILKKIKDALKEGE